MSRKPKVPMCTRIAWPVLAVLLPCLSACGTGTVDPDADLVIHGARVWDGTGAPMSGPMVVQLGAGRIISVEPLRAGADFAGLARAAGVAAVDGTGFYIIPGLINTHGHVGGTWSVDRSGTFGAFAEMELARYARFGVTSVNSLGGDREGSFALRDASWGEGSPGHARILVSGPVVTGSAPEELTLTVDAVASMGPDWIKIRVDDNLGATTKMSPESYRAVIERARQHGLRVATHLFYQEDAKGLLRAGTGLVAHSIRDEMVDDETLGLFLETGVCYVPTLTREVSTYAYGERPAFFDDQFLISDVDSVQVEVVSDPARQAWVAASGAAEAYGRALDVAQANLARLVEAGVPIAFGTDSGPMGRFQGYFEHMEAELMAQAGLSAEQVLRSATGVAADCLGLDDVGTLQEGSRADLVLLRANPLEDIANLRQIHGVWVGGERVEGSRK